MNLQDAAHIGDCLAGLSTFAAVVLAGVELTRRRHEKLRERRSDAAARALVALTRACDALVAWADELADIADVEDPEMDFNGLLEDLQKADRVGRKAAAEPLRDLNGATIEAYVHLDPKEFHLLQVVHSLSGEMKEHLECLLLNLSCVPPGEELGIVRSIRDTVREGREHLRKYGQEGAAILQPIARFSAP